MTTHSKPKFINAIKLKCLYCSKTSLLKNGNWFVFDHGCKECNYRFEREIGYYTGASWMIAFPVVSLLGMGLAILMMLFSSLGSLVVAAIASVFMVFLGILLAPYFKSFWMFVDHFFHPINDQDDYNKELKN